MIEEKIKKIEQRKQRNEEAKKLLIELKTVLKTNKAVSEKTGINISQIEQALSGRIMLPEKHIETLKKLLSEDGTAI